MTANPKRQPSLPGLPVSSAIVMGTPSRYRPLKARGRILVCLVLGVGMVAFAAGPAASAGGATDVQQGLSQASGPAGAALIAQAEKLAHRLDLPVNNEPFTSDNIGQEAEQMRSTMSDIAKLITAGSYVAGYGFAIAAIAKFKAHKINPTQVPISMPIVLLFVATALIFLPSVFRSAGGTLFDPSASPSPVSGIDLLDIVSLGLQQAQSTGAARKTSRGPLLAAKVSAGIRADLSAHGLTGQMLDTYTQLGVLTADALVAGARV